MTATATPGATSGGPAARPPVVVAVDIGTTSTKVVAFDTTGELLASESVGYVLTEPARGQAVQDPDEILRAVTGSVASVVGRVGAGRVAGLSFSSALHSLMALSPAGEPLTPLVTWADSRAALVAERLRTAPGGLAVHRRTGTPLHMMAPLAKLAWFAEHEPDLAARVATWVGIKEYVILRLCGTLVIDHSIASATGLMNMHSLDWDEEALRLAGITPAQLPRLVGTTTVLELSASAADSTGLPAGTAVVVGAGDGPLANLGVGAVRPGVAACSIGTSGALRVLVDEPAVDPLGQVFCYALTATRWVMGGAVNNGGVVLAWAGDALAPDLETGREPEVALLELAARAPAGSGGLLMQPYLLSERAPHWDSLARGAYVGLTRAHRREHLARAALEGVCLQLALVLASMRSSGLAVTEIRATGGVMRSALWRQILSDALGMELHLTESHEGSAFGAALLGMEALGLIESVDVAADLVRTSAVVRPDPRDAAVYASLLPVFAGLYDALAPTSRALRQLADDLPMDLRGPPEP